MGMMPHRDKDELTSKQIAHMIWYVLDGKSRGRKEVELDQERFIQ